MEFASLSVATATSAGAELRQLLKSYNNYAIETASLSIATINTAPGTPNTLVSVLVRYQYYATEEATLSLAIISQGTLT